MLPFRILLITDVDATRKRARGVVETIARALEERPAGVAVLVRDKRSSADDVARCCGALRPITARAGALLLVHTHAHLVARLGLDGAHVDSRARVDEARIAMPRGSLLGASRHAGDALDDDVDYVTMSPVFRPSSKPRDAREALGLQGLRAAVERARVPVVALGGVDDLRARACLAAGAAAVAVVGAVMSARDPAAVVAALA